MHSPASPASSATQQAKPYIQPAQESQQAVQSNETQPAAKPPSNQPELSNGFLGAGTRCHKSPQRSDFRPLANPHIVRRCFPQAHSTEVVVSSLCPPRRWSGAEMGIGILRGLGDSWKSLKFKKWISHKYQESTRTKNLKFRFSINTKNPRGLQFLDKL